MAVGVSLTNLRTTDSVEAQILPAGLRERVRATFAGLEVLGYSHQPRQFRFTEGYRLEGVVFRYNARSSKRAFTPERVAEARRFFLSLQYAPKGDDVLSGSPDRCLFTWPNFLALTCHVELEEIEHFDTFPDGRPRYFAVRFSLVGVSDERILPEVVRSEGFGGGPGQ